ncbi:MAG: glycosyl transferase [Clostridia bacterium]|nr:glycosyl transferase [Clostridia bacterium]
MEQKIPKIIHYCWFGGNPLPEAAVKCMESWKKYCPDYEIMEWNEENFPTDFNDYVKEAYEAKKWAFVSDVARLYALVRYGGVYMDTDIEVVKNIDDILVYDAISGFESSGSIPTGMMAAKKGHPFFIDLLHDYDGEHFIMEDGSYNMTTNVVRITEPCLANGLKLNNKEQTVCGFTFKPMDYFCAKDAISDEVKVTENTYTIHHFNSSWITDEKRWAKEYRIRHKKLLPRFIAPHVSCFLAAWKFRGIFAAFGEIGVYLKSKRKMKEQMKKYRQSRLNKKTQGETL